MKRQPCDVSTETSMTAHQTSIGLCLGASTVSIVLLGRKGQDRPFIMQAGSIAHEGNPRQTLQTALTALPLKSSDHITGTGRKLRDAFTISTIPEARAVEYAFQYAKPGNFTCSAIVSAGGETFMVYALDRVGNISKVITGNKCASGTGEFFVQQLRRMDVPLDEVAEHLRKTPFKVSGRCSVFCKSDCTHATNNGVPKAEVTAGLCQMMAQKIIDLLAVVDKKNIMLIGGTSRNMGMVDCLRKSIKNLFIPDEATFFEALGCALYGLEHSTPPIPVDGNLFRAGKKQNISLPPLIKAENLVSFESLAVQTIRPGDTCILGLDVGSTTTKAVLMRKSDTAILESVYLRTNGDPVTGSINCYRNLLRRVSEKINPDSLAISGIGICGSGRRIAGLHASSRAIINEITAHARAAVYFDPGVDTIFEIGGQDAKYTLLTGGVPSDYAMNEACSAGTGSFLEEAASTTLGVAMEDIAEAACQGSCPANFNDQCAAFIGSDIKNAVHDNTGQEDILAGLVYSVCQNYLNRVKGCRPVGEKIFMQGGVCYNKAVPLAMASLLQKPIVVPPFPGLMGAFGAALAVRDKLEQGVLPVEKFDLRILIQRRVKRNSSFTCRGTSQGCDRGCAITLLEIDDTRIPFGGACDKYYNRHINNGAGIEAENLVADRQRLIFRERERGDRQGGVRPGKTVGLNRSFLLNTYYPMFSTFFKELGLHVTIPGTPDSNGKSKMSSSFCFPVEISHTFFQSMINSAAHLDFIFLPQIKAIPTHEPGSDAQLCPFVQAEPYYLKTAFDDALKMEGAKGTALLSPVLDMTAGLQAAQKPLVQTALDMGYGRKEAKAAFARALQNQQSTGLEIKALGKSFLASLEGKPEKRGIVLFGRPYNSFTPEANKNIPGKFASRGVPIIPFDCLPVEQENPKKGLFWGLGQHIYKGAQFVSRHPQLFGVFITNFSCGPDSFIISYFRDVMGEKPSLTLELDSHTADAGLETRIEAFLDIIEMTQVTGDRPRVHKPRFIPARIFNNGREFRFQSAEGCDISLKHPDVEVVIPSMGKYSSEAMCAGLRKLGYSATVLPPATEKTLALGRAKTLGKECLPMILVTGMFLDSSLHNRKKNKIAFFLPTASGPCRLGQYGVYLNDFIKKEKIPDTAILSISSRESYSGMDKHFQKNMWRAALISDAMEDIRSVILAGARDVGQGLSIFNKEWTKILAGIETCDFAHLKTVLGESAGQLRQITLKKPLGRMPVIALVGEIFVRKDALSRQFLTERLAERGFAVQCAPIAEWFYYIDAMVSKGYLKRKLSITERIEAYYRKQFMVEHERTIQSIFQTSGLYHARPVEIDSVIDHALPFIPMDLAGEGILTVGSSLKTIATEACGVIAIGPFGCMPNRIAESVLARVMNREKKMGSTPENLHLQSVLSEMDHLPFLTIESDGQPFPQIIEAQLEAFLLRAERLHARMTETVDVLYQTERN
jgi:predicted CoA-substrate-specific enzyme activase